MAITKAQGTISSPRHSHSKEDGAPINEAVVDEGGTVTLIERHAQHDREANKPNLAILDGRVGQGMLQQNANETGSTWDAYDSDMLELESVENQLRWINSAACPGPDFGRSNCTRNIRLRSVADNCMVFSCDANYLQNKWIVLVGDSNMRYLYFSILDKTKFAAELGGAPDERYRDREAVNRDLRLRFSFRFVDTRERTADDCPSCDGRTKMDRVMADMRRPRSENGTLLPTPPGRYDRPDLVMMNTGLWELIAIESAEEWHSAKPTLRSQFRELLQRWKIERTSKRLVWMTSPSVRPRDKLRKRRMNKDRMRWLAAMETRTLQENFPEIALIENWAWTEKEGFQDSDYHYYNCSMATERKLVMGTMCYQLSLPPVWDDN